MKSRISEPGHGDGLCCAKCGCAHLPVLYTRRHPGNRIKRVRECRHCGHRLVTYESASPFGSKASDN